MTITQPTQPPKLTSISITSLHLTRTSFVALLRACPALTNVDVWETVFTLDQALDTFQHTGVTSIKALMKVVVMPNQPSIFIHFPNLRQWDTASSQTPDSFPTQLVKDTFSIWCPKLIEIKSNFTSSNLLVHLLVKDVFINLTALTFRYECMSEDLVQTIACYPTKWTKICCYPPSSNSGEKEDDILQRQDQFQSSGRILQLWPRLLEKLVTLDIIEHKMNIDEVEKASWSCNDLETLFVRIQGLSTKEKIDSVLMRLKEMKALQRRKSGTPVIAVRMDDHDREMSIEARVLNHLLKFKKLKYVSLGSTAWTV
ncbi:hypothetical protein BX616_006270 [Lobosporangium transversale]|nr:hypothetical protein BX616_006270 [Lobosporangium transversale]